jgi:hypothetical protein
MAAWSTRFGAGGVGPWRLRDSPPADPANSTALLECGHALCLRRFYAGAADPLTLQRLG